MNFTDSKFKESWIRTQRNLEANLARKLDDESALPWDRMRLIYPANLVAHAITALELLGYDKMSKRVLELGFGRDPHIPLFLEYSFDIIGVDIAQESVDLAQAKGYEVIKGDIENIDAILNHNYQADLVVSRRMFEYRPFIYDEASGIEEETHGMFHGEKSIPKRNEEEAHQKGLIALMKLYDKTSKNGVHVHATTGRFILTSEEIRRIGYEVIGLNEGNHNIEVPFFTVLKTSK